MMYLQGRCGELATIRELNVQKRTNYKALHQPHSSLVDMSPEFGRTHQIVLQHYTRTLALLKHHPEQKYLRPRFREVIILYTMFTITTITDKLMNSLS